MLQISDATMASFQANGLRSLRASILAHWHQDLQAAGEAAGPQGRDDVLNRIDAMSRDNGDLTVADLTMLADLMLVDVSTPTRRAAAAR